MEIWCCRNNPNWNIRYKNKHDICKFLLIFHSEFSFQSDVNGKIIDCHKNPPKGIIKDKWMEINPDHISLVIQNISRNMYMVWALLCWRWLDHIRPCAYQWFQECACKVCETHRSKVKWQKTHRLTVNGRCDTLVYHTHSNHLLHP